ncbi:bifunctional diaminohydroxyphosphoribosylaminopyrimidine deaminase/5-amino-6-(5-phosphoribosylamino)uracil reductase RibD [Pontibacillus salicampi]|uniref:Riboflavin biosynthesis protein RibD n=1 Tax=Pontibacillus salicampi TaxID=1449801 RepID=A0ABV6LRP9_9BACI
MTQEQDRQYMELAIQMAAATTGQTSPNPHVGAVVVHQNEVLGMGAHLKAGEAHAEVHALNMAGNRARGGTIYVTLEPCSHHGRTPPCAERIIQSGIARAVIATLDPNPKVAGQGVQKLREAGIEVEVGLQQEEADQLNQVFYHYISTNTPYVTMKTAMTMDGKIATTTGESQWITGEAARADVHQYRHANDAILVGVNTVIQDKPRLTARLPDGGNHPTRIVLDTHLRTPIDSPLIQNPDAPTWILTGNQVEQDQIDVYQSYPHVEIIKLSHETIFIPDVLTLLGDRGITSLFVEGGAQVNDAFVRAGAVQQVIQYIAPKLLGGKDAPTPVGGEGIGELQAALALEITEVSSIGQDIKVVAKQKRQEG